MSAGGSDDPNVFKQRFIILERIFTLALLWY